MADARNPARTLALNPQDNLLVALETIDAGTALGGGLVASQRVPRGHKLAARPIAEGEAVLKFGQIIGFATAPIPAGAWIHEHNVAMRDFARDYAFCESYQPTQMVPEHRRATFEGYKRANGKVGTRNYIGILTSVNCSASVANFIAKEIERSGILDDFPNVDGVIPLVHGGGCALDVKARATRFSSARNGVTPPTRIWARC